MGIESTEYEETVEVAPTPEVDTRELDNEDRADELGSRYDEPPEPDAPTRAENYEQLPEILARPDVAADTNAMLADSQLDDPTRAHAEGAYLIENPDTGEVRVERVPSDSSNEVTWNPPPQLDGSERLVGLYHTRAEPSIDGNGVPVEPTPTAREQLTAIAWGVPGVVANDHGATRYM